MIVQSLLRTLVRERIATLRFRNKSRFGAQATHRRQTLAEIARQI
jgi:hypothetical protein